MSSARVFPSGGVVNTHTFISLAEKKVSMILHCLISVEEKSLFLITKKYTNHNIFVMGY